MLVDRWGYWRLGETVISGCIFANWWQILRSYPGPKVPITASALSYPLRLDVRRPQIMYVVQGFTVMDVYGRP